MKKSHLGGGGCPEKPNLINLTHLRPSDVSVRPRARSGIGTFV